MPVSASVCTYHVLHARPNQRHFLDKVATQLVIVACGPRAIGVLAQGLVQVDRGSDRHQVAQERIVQRDPRSLHVFEKRNDPVCVDGADFVRVLEVRARDLSLEMAGARVDNEGMVPGGR